MTREKARLLGLVELVIAGLVLGRLLQSQLKRPAPASDDAPGRDARQSRFGDYRVAGTTLTIAAPRERIYQMWREPAQLARFMQDLSRIEEEDGQTIWVIATPSGEARVATRLVLDRPGEAIAWRSAEGSDFQIEAKVQLRDAGQRGTEVDAHIAYVPRLGALGDAVSRAFAADPQTRGRRELKRLKMLLETGEIATADNERRA